MDAIRGVETIDDLKKVWVANKMHQTDQAFIKAKDKRKTELEIAE